MEANITREQALALLREYNEEPFHIQHALTVEGVLRWYARELGCGADEEFWALAGLLHDIDFERWPEEHCRKAPELLEKGGCSPELIHAVCSHGYGICCDVEPVHEMEKVLFAADELTGLIGAGGPDAAQQVRPGHGALQPEKEVQGQEVCRWLLPGRHPHRRRAPWLGAGHPAGADHRGHALLRGGHSAGDGPAGPGMSRPDRTQPPTVTERVSAAPAGVDLCVVFCGRDLDRFSRRRVRRERSLSGRTSVKTGRPIGAACFCAQPGCGSFTSR